MRKVLLVLFLASSAVCQTKSLNAREYYDELYKARGLDNFVDQYVCFREDSIPTFFLMSDSKALKDLFQSTGGMKDLPPDLQKDLKQGFLIVRSYHKGITQDREFFDRDGENEGNWIEKLEVPTPTGVKEFTVRLLINWDTLRYTRSVFTAGMAVPRSESGKCEPVAPGILQHGAPENKKSE